MAGRPSTYTEKTAPILCRRLADGESLRRICEDEGMPNKSTVFEWIFANPEFSNQYARARELQAQSYADDIVDIADTDEDSNRARVRIDARKWHSSKLFPKKYGDKQTLEHTDPQGNNPFGALMEMIGANGRPSPSSSR